MHAKARSIENALSIHALDPRWTVPSLMERSPLTRMVEIDGLVVAISRNKLSIRD